VGRLRHARTYDSDERGIAYGARAPWSGVPIVVVRFTPHQGGRESRPQGEGAQATGYLKIGRYA
jgi:hypothetical protein